MVMFVTNVISITQKGNNMRCDICTGELSSTSNGGRCGRCSTYFPIGTRTDTGICAIIKDMREKIRDLENENSVHHNANEIFPPLINKINAIMYEIYQNVMCIESILQVHDYPEIEAAPCFEKIAELFKESKVECQKVKKIIKDSNLKKDIL